jgi:hypothetical protein
MLARRTWWSPDAGRTVVCYESRKLNEHEKNYVTHDLVGSYHSCIEDVEARFERTCVPRDKHIYKDFLSFLEFDMDSRGIRLA